MARLAAVYRDGETRLGDREIPLEVDDALSLVLRFENPCALCEKASSASPKEFQRFAQRFQRLSSPEMQSALTVEGKEVFQNLARMFPCVGCRRSVETMFNEMKDREHNPLDPLFINGNDQLTVAREHTFNPKMIYSLFYVHGSKCNEILGAIPKSKKNKRCLIHSLETQKPRTSTGNWMDIWEALSQECREELVRLQQDGLVETVETYLRKHKFCTECRAQVMRAYDLLVGEVDCSEEKEYCPAVYGGLKWCSGDSADDRCVHVHCDTRYIATLISRAEPELAGDRRERHAKTIKIAQEEILTCVGVFLYDRLVKVWQRLKADEQTWQLLFLLGVETLKKKLELVLEGREGISQFELVCEELEEEERLKLQRELQKKAQKRQKKKKQREAAKTKEATPTRDESVEKTTEGPGSSSPFSASSSASDSSADGAQPESSPPSDLAHSPSHHALADHTHERTPYAEFACIPMTWPCDSGCPDQSDGRRCDQRNCSNGNCGQIPWVCDVDCGDISDGNCPAKRRNESECSCDDAQGCVSWTWRCDGDIDCVNRSGEQACPAVSSPCAMPCVLPCAVPARCLALCCSSGRCVAETFNCHSDNNNNNCGSHHDSNIHHGGGCGLPFAESDSPRLSLSGLSLEEMLKRADETAAADDRDRSDGERRRHPLEFAIPAEDIDFYRCNKHRLQQQRLELRRKLKTQFLDMQRRLGCASPSCVTCADESDDFHF